MRVYSVPMVDEMIVMLAKLLDLQDMFDEPSGDRSPGASWEAPLELGLRLACSTSLAMKSDTV